MKKKLVICLCMTMLGLAGCGKESSEADVVLQDDMTTDEAIKYAQQLFAENVDDSEDMDELLDNMFDDAVEDFMGDGASEVDEEEETDVPASSETEEEKQLYLEPTGMILADLPEGYEKVWELEEDNILVEFFELSDGDSTIAKITNKNPFDVNAHVEYRFKSADPMDSNYQCLIAGDNTYVANQVYFDVVGRPMESDSWKDMNEGKDYYYLPDDEKVVEGLKFEIIEWNEEDFNLKYKITNNLDRNISLVDLKWILFDGSNVENVKYTRPVDGDERPLYPGESIVISENPYGLFNKETKKLMVSYCYDADSSDEDATKDEQKKVEYTKIDTDYGSYLFAVTGVKMIPSGDGEKVYQISWECENIDFGAKNNSSLELPADALVITDSDGYKVAERSSFQDGETLNREGVVLYSGEKCKAYSVFSINNEACEYLTIGIDTRMDDSMQKVYVEK
ncbi:MAG: hypothetical protein IJN64_14350 [Lachnospiraceae bacterium]|nr:hypothetical protein [Lachnospiraceae bacterium]